MNTEPETPLTDELLSESEMTEMLLDGAVEDAQRAVDNIRNNPLLAHMLEKPPENQFEK